MPKPKPNCNHCPNVEPIQNSGRKPPGVMHLPPDHPAFEQSVATNLEGTKMRLADIVRRIEAIREPTLSLEGQVALRDALGELAGGKPQAGIYALLAHDYLSFSSLEHELQRNRGSVHRDWSAEKLRMLARGIANVLPLQQCDHYTEAPKLAPDPNIRQRKDDPARTEAGIERSES